MHKGGGVVSRREALAMWGAFVVAAACNGHSLFAPQCGERRVEPVTPSVSIARRDIYIVDSFSGLQLGTKDNPYCARTTLEFDGLMRSLQSDDHLALHLAGRFGTRGSYEWGDYAYLGWRAGKFWTFDGDAEVRIDSAAIADAEIDDAPLRIITTREQLDWSNPDRLTAAEVWAGLPRGQAVRGLTLMGSHSQLADRWRARGKILRTSGCILQGHNAAIEGVRFKDFGGLKGADRSLSAETFPGVICGAMGALDRNKIAQLDPATHRFDEEGEPSHVTGSTFDDYDASKSDDQVTVFMIVGSTGEPGGSGTGNWRQTMRANCYHERNTVIATGKNLVQGFTIYQAERGRVRLNRTVGADIGYYGDFYATRGILIEENDLTLCRHAVALYLSPAANADAELPKHFSHEDYTIGANRVVSSEANVSLDTLGPSTDTRFIRNIRIHPSLSLASVGATDVRREACTD